MQYNQVGSHHCSYAVCSMMYTPGNSKAAIECGRDAASIFRSKINSAGIATATSQAEKVINSQCPSGLLELACATFAAYLPAGFSFTARYCQGVASITVQPATK